MQSFPLHFGEPLVAIPQLEALLPAAVQQLDRDFTTAGLEGPFETQQYTDVFALRDAVEAALHHPTVATHLPQLLYRADIPEKYTQQINASNRAALQVIAELLVIRALQKVWFRQQYSSH